MILADTNTVAFIFIYRIFETCVVPGVQYLAVLLVPLYYLHYSGPLILITLEIPGVLMCCGFN